MNGLFSIIPLIVIFPFAGVIINLFFGRMLMADRDSKSPGVIASILAGLSFLIAVLMWIGLQSSPEGASVPFVQWMTIEAFARALIEIARQAEEQPELLHQAPQLTRRGRLDEASAARKPVLKHQK